MSKRSDNEWGRVWCREAQMEAGVALQRLATSVYCHWRDAINRESRADAYDPMVGLGQIHDIWNMMYGDMKALYTLEQIVNNTYKTVIVEREAEDGTLECD